MNKVSPPNRTQIRKFLSMSGVSLAKNWVDKKTFKAVKLKLKHFKCRNSAKTALKAVQQLIKVP